MAPTRDGHRVQVHTYAAACIERLMTVRDEHKNLRFGKDALKPAIQDLLTKLFAALEFDDSKENDYIMKGLQVPTVMGAASSVSTFSHLPRVCRCARNRRALRRDHY